MTDGRNEGSPDWSGSVSGLDLGRVQRLRTERSRDAVTFRDTVRAIGREKRQRVVPLPLAIGAIVLPFLAAWAAAAPGAAGADRAASTWPRPPAALDREHRLPADPGGYVDVWGPAEEWEQRLLGAGGAAPQPRRPLPPASERAPGD